MFDTVGTHNDDEATRRSLASLLITTLGLGASLSFLLGYGAMTVASQPAVPMPDDGPLVYLDPGDDPTLPDAPPPPPPPAAAATVFDPVDTKTTEADEPDERVKDLTPVQPMPVVDRDRPAGTADGVEGGETDGIAGGQLGGVPDGTLGGTGDAGGPIRVFHHSEVETRRRVDPRYPDEASALGLGAVSCRVTVTIDARGQPEAVDVDRCPEPFATATRTALTRWRWYPARHDGQKVRARTTIMVRYQP
jgi:outer membrane biosynthesis protein TonB